VRAEYKRKRDLSAAVDSMEEKEIKLAELRERANADMLTLLAFKQEYTAVQAMLDQLYAQEGLEPPSRPSSARSDRSAAAAGPAPAAAATTARSVRSSLSQRSGTAPQGVAGGVRRGVTPRSIELGL